MWPCLFHTIHPTKKMQQETKNMIFQVASEHKLSY